MKPLASPSATQFLFQNFLRRPVVKRRKRGSARGWAVEIRQQRGGRLVIADVPAAVDIAIANAMLQRNAPLPTRCACGGACERRELAGALARHCHGAIARKPVRPVLVAGLQRLLDQQAAKARAVDEEVRLDAPVVIQMQRADETILWAQLHVQHFALDARDTPCLRVPAQVLGVEPRVEVKRIGKERPRRPVIVRGAPETASLGRGRY